MNGKKTGLGISPFNCIALKDIKDKNSKEGDLRPLFDSVSTIGECVKKLHTFLEADNDPSDKQKVNAHIKSLTEIQLDFLNICQTKVAKQNEFSPSEQVGPDQSENKIKAIQPISQQPLVNKQK